MRKVIIAAFWVCVASVTKAQNLIAEGTAPNLYISHTVAPKENFYSIGRLYNQAPKAIATFNSLAMENGLKIGQHVKIPLNASNFDITGQSAAGESLMPLTHVVAKSETLFKIGTDFKVPAQSLKQWNNLSSDNITPGAPLIVGHLKIKGDQTAVSSVKANAATNTTVAVTKPEQKTTAPAVKDEPVVVAPPAQKEEKKDDKTFSSIETKKAETPTATTKVAPKEEVKETAPVKTTAPVKEPVKEASPTPAATEQKSAKSERRAIDLSNSAEGAFSSIFTSELSKKSLNNKNGEAATFKSTSGWQDKKYYVLMNEVAPGTIVKIQGGPEGKVVYAKVLGSMPEMKENNGLMLRVSNAAAAYLGIVDPKFPVEISYYQ